MVSSTKLVTGAAAAVTAGSLVFAGASLARADSTTDSNAAGSSTCSAQADRGRGGHAHTEVTGDEATKVTKAVTTTDSAVTVESVRKDPDGSYDVMGTKNGERVMVEVSADLKSVEVRQGGPGPGDGHGGPGGMNLTAVTGQEATKVGAAVRAKDSGFTVERVGKTDDGAYLVAGTKDGERAMARVAGDLKSVDIRTGDQGPDGPGGRGGHAHTEVTGDEATKVTKAVTTTDSAVTVESVRKDPDGSYDVMGTKNGERVMVEVSADLKSVEVRTGGPARDNGQQATRSDEATSARTTVPSTGTSPTSIPSVA